VGRIPVTTVFETIHTLFSIIGWLLYGFDIANSSNGGGPAIFILVILPFMAGFILSCVKLVHLGKKIIPKTVRFRLVGPVNNKSQEGDVKLDSLKADPILGALFASMVLTQSLALLFLVVVGTSVNPGQSDIWSRIGMGLEGMVAIVGFLIVFRQTYRVVNYIETVHKKQMEVNSGGQISPMATGVSEKILNRTIQMLKLRAFAVGLSVTSSIIFFFLCAAGTFVSWYFLLLIMYASIIGSTGTTFMYKPSSMRVCCCCRDFRFGSHRYSKKDSKTQDTTSPPTSSRRKTANNNVILTAAMPAVTKKFPESSVVSPSETGV
jgi:hypothetical protein